MKIQHDAPTEEVQIQIIPLIDVIFCILTFFILAALQFTRQQAISVDLPKATTAKPLPGMGMGDNRFREMVVVTISNTGQTFLDQKPIDRSQLALELQAYIQQKPNGMLVLNASPNAFYNDVIQVIDVMRAVGGDRVALATAPTNTNPAVTPGTTPPAGSSPFPTTSPSFDPFDPFGTTPQPGNTSAPGAPIPGATIRPRPGATPGATP